MQKLLPDSIIPAVTFDEQVDEKVFAIISVLISAMEDKDPYTSGILHGWHRTRLQLVNVLAYQKKDAIAHNHALQHMILEKLAYQLKLSRRMGNYPKLKNCF
jgi:hypothetical protein